MDSIERAASSPESSEVAEAVRRSLLDFYDEVARDLPWRRTDDPYAIWVSEIMLQQTRVETVIPYYRRWMERYPDVDALAGAGVDEVLKSWEGLGYYRRATALHSAARVVRERHDGRVPSTVEELAALPGVGAYTSGAIASIAFDRPEPAVDGNVRRVVSRLLDERRPTARRLEAVVRELIDPGRPGEFNQALMELGATVCTPRAPKCGACPLRVWCRSAERGTQEEVPAAKRRGAEVRRRFGVAVLVRSDGAARDAPEVLIARRPEGGLLGGLWELPTHELTDGAEAAEGARDAAARHGIARTGAVGSVALEPVVHRYSHFTGIYYAFVMAVSGTGSSGRWATFEGLSEVALPAVQRRIVEEAQRHVHGR